MFDESKHPRAEDGRFTDGSGTGKTYRQNSSYNDILAGNENKKMTPAEKIASVHIDFNRDNILPELNEADLEKIGSKVNKPVLLKKSVIERNIAQHSDLTTEDFESIIAHALYSPSEIFKANGKKPYYHFAKVIEVNSKGKPEIGLALLDVDDSKDNFEIVHAHLVRERSFNLAKKKT